LNFSFERYRRVRVNTSENQNQPQPRTISTEGMIGIGITIAALGLLSLLLGWAQQMRAVPSSAAVWFGLGAILAIAGILIALFAKTRKRRR
jgi:hypothetical protein